MRLTYKKRVVYQKESKADTGISSWSIFTVVHIGFISNKCWDQLSFIKVSERANLSENWV